MSGCTNTPYFTLEETQQSQRNRSVASYKVKSKVFEPESTTGVPDNTFLLHTVLLQLN